MRLTSQRGVVIGISVRKYIRVILLIFFFAPGAQVPALPLGAVVEQNNAAQPGVCPNFSITMDDYLSLLFFVVTIGLF